MLAQLPVPPLLVVVVVVVVVAAAMVEPGTHAPVHVALVL
jgi:hypothetical protein